MKFYLDTNIVREILKHSLPKDFDYELFTSELVIGELISGIVSEDKYIKRKNILKKIIEKNISIIWESPRTLLIKSFDLPLDDTDAKATQIMMTKVIESKSYEELKNISFCVENSLPYTLETFINFDNTMNKDIQNIINKAIKIPSKEDKKRMRDIAHDVLCPLVHSQIEVVIRDFLMNFYNTENVEHQGYSHSCMAYFQHRNLETYFKAMILSSSNSIANSQNAGSNDGFDYWNLVYSAYADFFVSNDKIYKRLKKYEDDFFDIKFITLEGLKSKCKYIEH